MERQPIFTSADEDEDEAEDTDEIIRILSGLK